MQLRARRAIGGAPEKPKLAGSGLLNFRPGWQRFFFLTPACNFFIPPG